MDGDEVEDTSSDSDAALATGTQSSPRSSSSCEVIRAYEFEYPDKKLETEVLGHNDLWVGAERIASFPGQIRVFAAPSDTELGIIIIHVQDYIGMDLHWLREEILLLGAEHVSERIYWVPQVYG